MVIKPKFKVSVSPNAFLCSKYAKIIKIFVLIPSICSGNIWSYTLELRQKWRFWGPSLTMKLYGLNNIAEPKIGQSPDSFSVLLWLDECLGLITHNKI